MIEAATQQDEQFKVFPENRLSIAIFLGVITQFSRYGECNWFGGLNYQAVKIEMNEHPLVTEKNRWQVWCDIKVLEQSFLEAINKQ